MGEDNIGSISSSAATGVNISSLDPALVVTEPTPNNFDLDFNEGLSKIPFLKTSYIAGEVISALKIVYINSVDGKAYVAQSDGIEQESLVIGVALNAVILNDTVDVIILGLLQDASWSWTTNELLFLGPTGSITNVPPSLPTDNYSVVVGKALTNNKILVSVEPPIQL